MVWGEIQSPLLGRCSNQLMCWTSLGSAKPCPVLGRWTSLGFAKPCPLLGRWTAGCTHPVHLYRCSRRSWHNACPSGSWHDKCPRHEICPSRKCPGFRCSGRRFCRSCEVAFIVDAEVDSVVHGEVIEARACCLAIEHHHALIITLTIEPQLLGETTLKYLYNVC